MSLTNLLMLASTELTFTDVALKILYVIAAIGILLFMITIHEFGHYTAGKLLKFKINEFSVGMGPKLFQRKRKNSDEVFSLRLIPLGGYCAFEGEDEEVKSDECFNAQAPWKRLIVLFSGAFFNFISAILIAIIAFSCFGEYQIQVSEVYSYSPNVGILQEGDIIISIDGTTLYLTTDFTVAIAEAGDTMEVIVFRPYDTTVPVTSLREGFQGETVTLNVNKRLYTVEGDGISENYTGWGIHPASTQDAVRYGFAKSFVRSFGYCYEVGTLVLKTLGGLFTGSVALTDVSGPIGTIDMASQVVETGFSNVLYLITLISVNLAVFNLLPVPALDGCRMVFVLVEWIFRKPINRKVEAIINFAGLILLFGFVILVDLLKLF